MPTYPIRFVDEDGNVLNHHDSASNSQFDNTESELNSENVQDAIDEIVEKYGEQPPSDPTHSGDTDPSVLNRLSSLEQTVSELQSTVNGSVESLAVPVGIGTFQQAFDTSKTNNALFTWLLDDTDDQGRTVRKLIYHISNGEFIDAIGARIVGNLSGFTVFTKGPASFTTNSVQVPLATGLNNFTVSGNNLVASDGTQYSCLANGKINGLSFGNKGNIMDVDFGDIAVKGDNIFNGSDFSSLRSVRRMKIYGTVNQCFYNNSSVQYIHMYSEGSGLLKLGTTYRIFCGTKNLRYLDIKNLNISTPAFTEDFMDCGCTVCDIRGFNTRYIGTNPHTGNKYGIDSLFSGSAVGTIIVGPDFYIDNTLYLASDFFSTCGNITIVYTCSTPPQPTTGNGETTYGTPVKWFPDRCTIKVPQGSIPAYQEAWPFLANYPKVILAEYSEGEY